MNLLFRKLIGILAKPFSLGYGCCYRCGRTWNVCKPHYTDYTSSNSCFPLCESCWGELAPEKRLPYYERLCDKWMSYGDPDYNGRSWSEIRNLMETAVLTERE